MRFRRGQTTLEYAMLIVIVIGAMVAMQMYIKRAIQGRWKDTMESIGEQYDPTAMQTNIRQSVESFSISTIYIQPTGGGNVLFWTLRNDIGGSIERKEGSSRAQLSIP